MAVADFFLTPTAELADIVLPAATWLEMDYIGDFWKRHGYILPRRKVIQVGECRSDHEMLNDLAHRIGQGAVLVGQLRAGPRFYPQADGHHLEGFQEDELHQGRGEVLQVQRGRVFHAHEEV